MLGAIVMVMLVDGLLLLGTGRLLNGRIHPMRILLGSIFGACFVAMSVPMQWESYFWQLLGLALTAVITFAGSPKGVVKILVFCLLHYSLGGLTANQNDMLSTLLGAAGIGLACYVVGKERKYLPVELTYAGCTLQLTALRDTGNTLRDPITGRAVLIVDAQTAEKLTGLEIDALQDPVSAMERYPGLRLIPYQTVGNSGFLLALLIQEAKIGNQRGSTLVAFSPNEFGGKYQALTGGSL